MTQEMHKSTIEMELMTKSMHKVAEKTERETTSMHIITFVTLVFLPGTFIAVRVGILLFTLRGRFSTNHDQTFFGSGLFQWDQNNPEQTYPAWKGDFFALFAKICFPLMAGTILIWFGAYWWATKHRANVDSNGNSDEEAQLLDSFACKAQEKA